jgi:hypothetical protein
MTGSSPSRFPALPPQLIPAMQLVEPPWAYHDAVRPSMMGREVGEPHVSSWSMSA